MTNDRRRLSISPSYAMWAALDELADREGATATTIATRMLRAALDRTINSASVQERIREHNAHRTAREWRNETMTETQVERDYEATQRAQAGRTGRYS